MASEKTEFEKKIVTKALAIQNIVEENLSSLQSTNTSLNFEPSKSVKLTKCGHDVLCKVELLKTMVGHAANVANIED